jgi:histidyl-tRNA synthetase
MATKSTSKKSAEKKNGVEETRSKRSERFSRLRGMKDILFDEQKYWNLVERKASDLASFYGFRRIQTPVLEKAALYERSSGKETDVVSKEMYTFTDKSGDKVALRPEATPGIVRAYIEHGLFNQPQPVKVFWLGPLFRHEKPQSGRLRQHHQFDLELFGEEGPVADAQLILIAYNFFSELQINVRVQVNSIGCPECREEYVKKLDEYYKERGKRSKLCADCRKRLTKNPLRLLDCKEDDCEALKEEAPQIVDYLCDSCREHFIKVLEYLDDMEVPYNLNPFLVRGLDYYNRTVFEISPADDGEGDVKRQSSLGGGGRYDNLVEAMGGRPSPACGFGLGLERVILKIKEMNIPLKQDDSEFIFVAQLGDQARRQAFHLFEEMRQAGYKVRQSFTKDSLKAQLEDAAAAGARYTLILGQKELMDETIIIRDMESGTQELVDYKKLYSELARRMNSREEEVDLSAETADES